MRRIQEETELVKLVYPDLAQIDGRRVHVRFTTDIEVVFTLPEGYPERCPPKHRIIVPASLDDIKQRINQHLESSYEQYAGLQVLTTCIAEVNHIVNSCRSEGEKDFLKDNKKKQPEKVQTVGSKVQRFNWISGDPYEDRNSTFQAHLVKITSKDDVLPALEQLKENNKITRATHNMYAYLVKTPGGDEQIDSEDDGEKGAGVRLTHLLRIMKVHNILVVVSRWYGGIHLGSERWRIICKVASELIQRCQLQNDRI